MRLHVNLCTIGNGTVNFNGIKTVCTCWMKEKKNKKLKRTNHIWGMRLIFPIIRFPVYSVQSSLIMSRSNMHDFERTL